MTFSTGRSEPNSPAMDIPRLIVRPQGGLGNRMRVITSFEILAKYSGRGFELCWGSSAGWSDEDLGDLFENDFPRVPLDEFEDRKSTRLNSSHANISYA